jgi:hypothetical protein
MATTFIETSSVQIRLSSYSLAVEVPKVKPVDGFKIPSAAYGERRRKKPPVEEGLTAAFGLL